ncbi:hypothetical protein ACLQ18_39465 [Streptomyces sp. DT193]|uniref:hypothetical protein n=1 Tax=Streptomyces sp. DT193 TaxID=3393418 RepID=UPI003CF7BBE4
MLGRILAAVVLTAGAVLTTTSAASADAGLRSASGCTGNPGSNGSKCIYISGSGLHVTTAKTTLTKNHADNCGTPHIDFGDIMSFTGPRTCEARDFTFGPEPVNYSFPNGTKACAWWSNYPEGKACITIHS